MRLPPSTFFLALGWVCFLGVPRSAAQDPPGIPRPQLRDRYGDPLPECAVARLGTVRLRHSDTINSVAFSPDGKLLASAGDDRAVVLWDVLTGKAVRTLIHPARVRTVLFSPDGKTLLSASNRNEDPRIYVWDVRSGKQRRFLEMPKAYNLAHMVLSRDGKTLLTSTVIGLVVAWDPGTGREIWRRKFEEEWWKCLAVAPDGKTFAMGGNKGNVLFCDLRTGKTLGALPKTRTGDTNLDILSLAYSPDGRTLAITDEMEDLKCWDVASRKVIHWVDVHTNILAPLAFSPDGKALACGSEQTLYLYDFAHKELAKLGGHQSWIRSVVFSPDGRYLASAGQDQTIRIWNTATHKPLHPFAFNPGGPCFVSFYREGSRLVTNNWCSGYASEHNTFTSGYATCTRQAWNACSASMLRERKPDSWVSGEGCLSPDGKVFARSDSEGLVRLTDAASGRVLRTVGKRGAGFRASPVAFSPDGRVVAVVSDELGAVVRKGWQRLDRLRLWDVATGRLLATAMAGEWINYVANVQFAPGGRLLAAVEGRLVGTGSTLHLWRLGKDNTLRRLPIPELRGEWSPVVSSDGTLLMTRSEEREDLLKEGKIRQTIRVREVLSGKVLLCLENQTGVSCYALSPDHRLLALGDEGGGVRLVEVLSGKEVRRLWGHRGSVASLEFSPDGRFLVSGSADTTALVWDIRACWPGDHGSRANRPSTTTWADLASGDVRKAFRAELAFRADPEKAVLLLRGRLRPIPPLNAEAVEKLIAELDGKRFKTRERAEARLRSLERTAIPLLKKARRTATSPEMRRRLDQLLADAEQPRNSTERLRDLRAVHCLRSLGTEAARQLLEKVAKGAPEARLTQEACEELECFSRHSPTTPPKAGTGAP